MWLVAGLAAWQLSDDRDRVRVHAARSASDSVQMDEFYALLSEMGSEEGERAWCWVWAAIDPISKLLLALEVGDRSLGMAQRLVHGVVSVLMPEVVLLFVTDQLAAYAKALLTHYGSPVTDHVWSMAEFLLFRVPLWGQESMAV
jgi:transposase-like protein